MSGSAGVGRGVDRDGAPRSDVHDRRARLDQVAWAGLAIGVGALVVLLALRPLMVSDAPWLRPPQPGTAAAAGHPDAGSTDEAVRERFVSFVFDDVQATWSGAFERHDLPYAGADLVLYRGSVATPCGTAPAATGPFYCHEDGSVYLDLAGYDALRGRSGAAVDLGGSDGIAREIEHHVQNPMRTLGESGIAPTVPPTEPNRFSADLELQAACFAGVWAASADARGVLALGDDAGRAGATALGGDRWSVGTGQRPSRAAPIHATSEQRWAWFQTGFATGDPAACDTVTAP